MTFEIVLLNKDAKIPQKGTQKSAGFDLYSSEELIIKPKTRSLVSTGIKISIPDDCYGQIAPRSGLSLKGIDIGAGVIDSDYRGEIKILLLNNSENDFKVEIGSKIAQIIFKKIYNSFTFQVVDVLDETFRGSNGFGSTGV